MNTNGAVQKFEQESEKPNTNIVFINNFTFGQFGGCYRKELLWIGRQRGKKKVTWIKIASQRKLWIKLSVHIRMISMIMRYRWVCKCSTNWKLGNLSLAAEFEFQTVWKTNHKFRNLFEWLWLDSPLNLIEFPRNYRMVVVNIFNFLGGGQLVTCVMHY